MRPDRSDEGFALVESIGVLLVSALILLALALTVGLVVRSSAAVGVKANEAEVLTSGLSAMRREIASALAVGTDADPKAAILFQGTPGAIGFSTAREIVWIEAVAGRSRGLLTRSARAMLPGINSLGVPDRRNAATLLSGPWAFRFSFAAFDEAGGAWIAEWIGRNRLPDLVRLDVLRADGRGRPVASLVESPRVRRDRRCIFDDPQSCLSPAVEVASP